MLERRTLGDIPPRPHTVFEVNGKPAAEYVFTRDGFSGGFSILYNTSAPTSVRAHAFTEANTARFIGERVPASEVVNARRHFKTWEAPEGKDFIDSRSALFINDDCRLSSMRGQVGGEDYAFVNGEGDELYFFYEGSGKLLTLFGELKFRAHDYVLIPRGVPYRFEAKGTVEAFIMEGSQEVKIPDEFKNPHGQLKLEAPYTHRDFRSPNKLLSNDQLQAFQRLLTLKNGRIHQHEYQDSPVDVVGWDGSVYPVAFAIEDYLPKTGKIHLPPNLHQTFASDKFVVCSFVPRMVDYGDGAIPCPYPHANVVCDEILYYVSGDFTSRKGVGGRSISHHPAGIPHGPQPGNYEASVGAKETSELAVMVDTWAPLDFTKVSLGIEDSDYSTSWV